MSSNSEKAAYTREWRRKTGDPRNRLTEKARRAAHRRLAAAYPAQFDELVRAECEARGIPPIGEVPSGRPPRPRAECSVDGCDDEARARGLCDRHYSQAKRAGLFHTGV